MANGTLDINDLLAVRHQSPAEFGLDRIVPVVVAETEAHNRLLRQASNSMVEPTQDRQRKYGTSIDGKFMRVDEYGPAPAQKTKSGETCGFPMYRDQFNVGFTATYLQQATVRDLAIKVQSVLRADAINIMREIKRAIFGAANYTVPDELIDDIDINVKRFVNADGGGIPAGPNGEVFDGATHTHYDAINGLTEAALKAQIDDVVEHGHGGQVHVNINRADADTVEGFTGFKELKDPRLIPSISEDQARLTLDTSRLDNRIIGIFHGALVWTKPWVPEDYSFAFDGNDPEKPLVMREQVNPALRGLRLAAQDKVHPLMVEFFERDFGIAVWNRTNGHVLYFGGASYVVPTFT